MAKSRPKPPDQEYRDRIATDLDRTMLVEAAAGTGKTTCLIDRIVGLLREDKCPIETLAAVTFTRKAAAELRTRFQLALENAAQKSSGKQRERLVAALNHVERCFIGTIHSFCARLLRERPVEAGVDPGFVELDDVLDAQLRRQAWREHVATLITTDDPILPELERLGLKVSASTRRSSSLATELDELGLEPAELGPAFLRYAEYSDVVDWPAQPVPLPDLKPCIQEVTDYTAHMQSLPLPNDHGNDKLMPKYDLISRVAKRLDLNQPAQLMELLEQFEGTASVVQKMWPGKKAQALAELDRWNDFVQQYAAPLLLAWREHRYEPVMRAIRPALNVYEGLRRERNGLNFQDLLLLSVALLRDKPEVRSYFRERFSHVLVDEFQDTDPIQAEVMLLLTADDDEETDWQQCRPVVGSLFVVGDPKQSIYRFRRADILTYSKVRSIVEQVGGEVIPLSVNFRSVEPAVQWVNDCFSNVFPADADDYNPADRPLEVGRDDGASEKSVVERLQTPAAIRWNNPVAESEADLIARTIRRAIDEKWPVPRTDGECEHGHPDHAHAGDFLIVARGKKRLTIYARKLQQYGLPHSVTGGSVLNEVPELELLSTCLAAVARSDDPVALVAVLRSELFGVADTVLYDLRRFGGRFSYHSEIPAELPADVAAVLRDAFERLQSYSRWLRRLPAAAAIERIAADLGLIARACAAEEGDAHAGSLLKAIELLRSADGNLTLGDYVDVVAGLVGQAEKHDGIPVRPPTGMPVRVMNLHQCKGLEAPFVFLVDSDGVFEYVPNKDFVGRDFFAYAVRHPDTGQEQVFKVYIQIIAPTDAVEPSKALEKFGHGALVEVFQNPADSSKGKKKGRRKSDPGLSKGLSADLIPSSTYFSVQGYETNAGSEGIARMRAYLEVPEDGDYVFWVASKGEAILRMNAAGSNPSGAEVLLESSGGKSAKRGSTLTAQEQASIAFYGLNGEPNQTRPISLKKGHRYYVELSQNARDGGKLALGWSRNASTDGPASRLFVVN